MIATHQLLTPAFFRYVVEDSVHLVRFTGPRAEERHGGDFDPAILILAGIKDLQKHSFDSLPGRERLHGRMLMSRQGRAVLVQNMVLQAFGSLSEQLIPVLAQDLFG